MSVVSTDTRVFKQVRQEGEGRSGQWVASAAQFVLRTVLGLLLPAALFALWQLAVKRQWLPEQILPGPDLVWQSFKDLWESGELLDHLAISAKRVGWSLLIGTSVGLVLGFGMGLSRTVRDYVLPTFDVVSQFPVLGWIPILMIFVGIDEALKICAISIAVVVPVAVNAQKGIANIPRAWFEVARVYGFTGAQVVRRVVLPAAAPSLFTGQLAQLDLVVVGMIMIGFVGVVLDLLLRALEARLQRWRVSAF
jgi:sulfonate transport system permease protein